MNKIYKQITLHNILREIQECGDYDKGIRRLVERLEERREFLEARYYYRTLLRRQPEDSRVASRVVTDIGSEIITFMHSAEFKIGFGRQIISEFPDLRRDLFIHVPKTGGSSVIAAARRDPAYAVVRAPSWGFDDISDPRQYFLDVANSLFSGAQAIIFEKHLRVSDILKHNMARGHDRIFTIMREPIPLIISWINYTLTSFTWTDDESIARSDIRSMRERVGVDSSYNPNASLDWAVVSRIIDQLVWANPHCTLLGAGDAAGAFENIVRLGIRVYDADDLGPLFREMGWQSTRENVSRPFLTFEELPALTKNQLIAMSYQDMALRDRLKTAGLLTTSVT